MTINHNYHTPERGTIDWHIPLNENFENLDTGVEIRDIEANRSEYQPKDGAKFLAIDTGEVYIGNGSEWSTIPASTSSSNPSFDSVKANAITLGSEAGPSGLFGTRPLISEEPLSFRVPEDYPTIQSALEHVPIFLRHRVQVNVDPGAGPYDEHVTVPAVIKLDRKGSGRNPGLVLTGNDGMGAGSGSKSAIQSLYVEGPHGTGAFYCHDFIVRNVSPFDSGNVGAIHVHGGTHAFFEHIEFDTYLGNPSHGFIAYGGANVRVDDIYLGTNNMRFGFKAKNTGRIYARENIEGTVERTVYAVGGGYIEIYGSRATGSDGLVTTARGMIYDGDDGTLYGVSQIDPGQGW